MTTAEAHPDHRKTYFVNYVALLVLLAATAGAAYLPLGAWSPAVALTIAFAKALLIVLLFMHVREETGLVRIFAAAGFLWLGLLLLLLMCDDLTRHDVIPKQPAGQLR